ncbi:hypothetical protein BT69DRAFT_197650 [Atractiella rhizophila]|nr:hypothetical protein BT69DRAFT_197650 [Atractiella rhizophila]
MSRSPSANSSHQNPTNDNSALSSPEASPPPSRSSSVDSHRSSATSHHETDHDAPPKASASEEQHRRQPIPSNIPKNDEQSSSGVQQAISKSEVGTGKEVSRSGEQGAVEQKHGPVGENGRIVNSDGSPAPQVRLDLDLEAQVELHAKVQGQVTLSLL